MAQNGYGGVDGKGFVSFGGAFEEGAWESVQIKKHDNEEMIALSPIASLPTAVLLSTSLRVAARRCGPVCG